MSWMPSTTVPGAESIPSRLGRLHSSHQLLLTRQSLFLAGACFSVFQDSHSCAKPRPKMCGGVPREAHTVTHRGQKAEHSCVIPPARRSSFLRAASTQDPRRKVVNCNGLLNTTGLVFHIFHFAHSHLPGERVFCLQGFPAHRGHLCSVSRSGHFPADSTRRRTRQRQTIPAPRAFVRYGVSDSDSG